MRVFRFLDLASFLRIRILLSFVSFIGKDILTPAQENPLAEYST
jgi:hypothetical protein